METVQPNSTAPLRAPRGFHTGKVDSTGRLKLPAKFVEYLEKLTDQSLFVTEINGMARIYTNGSWERNLALLDGDPVLKRRVAFRAEARGADVDIDPQKRITLPQTLRKDLKLEDSAVQLRFFEDVISIFPQAQFEEEAARCEAANETDLSRAAAMGFDVG